MTCGRNAANTIRVAVRPRCMETYAEFRATNNLEQSDCCPPAIRKSANYQCGSATNNTNVGEQVICDMSQSKHFIKGARIGFMKGNSQSKPEEACHLMASQYGENLTNY